MISIIKSAFFYLLLFISVPVFSGELELDRHSFSVSIEGGLICGQYLPETDTLLLTRYDAGLNEIETATITAPEIYQIFIACATISDFDSGVVCIGLNRSFVFSATNTLDIYINYDLHEMCRAFVSKEDYKRSMKTGKVLDFTMPKVFYTGNLLTNDGQLCLIPNDGKTSLVRYVAKNKKYALSWQTDFNDLSVFHATTIVRNNLIYLAIVSGIKMETDPYGGGYSKMKGFGQLNIICLDYNTGKVIWNKKVEMTEGLRPELPIIEFDAQNKTLYFAGMESITDKWKKEKKARQSICNIFLGSISEDGSLNINRLPIPSFETELSANKINIERPWWKPRKIINRKDGSHLVVGLFGFTGSPMEIVKECGYLEGGRWLAGTFSFIFNKDVSSFRTFTNCFTHFDTYGRNIGENGPIYWDKEQEIFYMVIINPNEGATTLTDKYIINTYLLEISNANFKFTSIKSEDGKSDFYPTYVYDGYYNNLLINQAVDTEHWIIQADKTGYSNFESYSIHK